MKLEIYAKKEDAVPVPASRDGDEFTGIPRDTCEYALGLTLYFRNNSDRPHSVSIGKTVREGEVAKPYDFYQFVIPPGSRDTVYHSRVTPAEAYFGPLDTFVPTEDLSELGVEEGDVQIQYLSGIDGLFVAAIGALER
jgi:hypothetical protein